eukprot:Gb_08196 [translate_table: standard]
MRIINEPTIYAIGCGLDKKATNVGEKNVLIFLGGGTFNVSLLPSEEGIFEVKAISSDTHLGVNPPSLFPTSKFLESLKIATMIKGTKELNRPHLSRALEPLARGIRKPSTAQTMIYIDSLCEGIDFYSTITHVRFGSIQKMDLNEKYLMDAKMDKSLIHNVVLIGGSTRIRKVHTLLRDFSMKELSKSINLDEVIAYGAIV